MSDRIPAATHAHYRRNASAPDVHVCSVAAGDLLALLDATECADPVTAAVMADLLRRSAAGISKYGATLARDDIDLRGWLNHGYEEALDLAQYLRRAMLEMENRKEKL